MVSGGIGLVVSTIGAVAMWNAGPNWYPVALALTALPYAWIGGLLERPIPPVAIFDGREEDPRHGGQQDATNLSRIHPRLEASPCAGNTSSACFCGVVLRLATLSVIGWVTAHAGKAVGRHVT